MKEGDKSPTISNVW